ncbi:MAG: hypothetical protein R6X13_11930 [bacterium]
MSIARAAAATALLGASLLAQGWVTTGTDTLTRNTNRKSVGMQALAADNSGGLHALWSEQTGNLPRRILYSRRPADSTWTPALVVSESTGGVPALAVDPVTGAAHACWCAPWGGPQDVFYGTNRSGTWQTQRLTTDTVTDYSPTIALDPAGHAHVAWITLDSTQAWRIAYATNRSGQWVNQVLAGSQLGGFGSGAAPYLAVSPAGIAHIAYRGGDYPAYRVHHAENSGPGDTAWTYEPLVTPNQADYSSGIAALDGEQLLLVISGNDGWGMPFRTCYLHRPAGTRVWDEARLMTADASAALRGFTQHSGAVHVAWEQINGNINTERIYHCWRRPDSLFYNSAVRADGQTSGGSVALTPDRAAHCLVYSGPTAESSQVYCLHSQPFTAVAEERPAALSARPAVFGALPVHLGPCPGPVRILDPAGRLVRRLNAGSTVLWDGNTECGLPVRPGPYFAVDSRGTRRLFLLR